MPRGKDQAVAVVGLGFVGLPVACALAEAGLHVVGLDVDAKRVERVNAGRYPIAGREPGMAELVGQVVAAGRLKATTKPKQALADADVVIVAVQTPFDTRTFQPRYDALRSACSTVGKSLRKGMMVIVESTVAPTTMETVVRPLLEKGSRLKAGPDFDLVHCPERVMPGKLLKNLRSLSRTVGGITPAASERARELYARIVQAELEPSDLTTAEVVKTAENAYRDVQIAFANELALLCERLGVDVYRVRKLVNKSPERNVHVPGAGVGGHCIPKDTWLLVYGAGQRSGAPLMSSARAINDGMPRHVARLVLGELRRARRPAAGARVLVLGAAYLPNTEDARNAPTATLVEELARKKVRVAIHDPWVREPLGRWPIQAAPVDALVDGFDALVLVTAHDEYRGLDLHSLGARMRTRILVDGRDVWSPAHAKAAGFRYAGVGKGQGDP